MEEFWFAPSRRSRRMSFTSMLRLKGGMKASWSGKNLCAVIFLQKIKTGIKEGSILDYRPVSLRGH